VFKVASLPDDDASGFIVAAFSLQQTIKSKIIRPEISLNALDFISASLATRDMRQTRTYFRAELMLISGNMMIDMGLTILEKQEKSLPEDYCHVECSSPIFQENVMLQ
jgi:hypothetical protein